MRLCRTTKREVIADGTISLPCGVEQIKRSEGQTAVASAAYRMIRSMRVTIAALKGWIRKAKEILKEPQEVYLADLLLESLRMRDPVAMTYARGRSKGKHNNTKRFMEECDYLKQRGVLTLSDFEKYLSTAYEKVDASKSSMNEKQQRL